MMMLKVSVTLLVVLLSASSSYSQPRTLRNFMCVGEISNGRRVTRPCREGVSCSIGPLTFTQRGLTFSATMCDEPEILSVACKVENAAGVTNSVCPLGGSCALGPTEIVVDGQSSMATFCIPRYIPRGGGCIPGATCTYTPQ